MIMAQYTDISSAMLATALAISARLRFDFTESPIIKILWKK